MASVRIGTFNVENLFSRARVLNFASFETGDEKLAVIAELQSALEEAIYDKEKIIQLYKQVDDVITFNVLRSDVGFNIISRRNEDEFVVNADGRDDWLGFIDFRRDKFSDDTSKNTARVIREIDTDILCMVEVEDRLTLKSFNSDRLGDRYDFNMCIDGNDRRGIDVGLYSKFALGNLHTNIFDRSGGSSRVFSRDCLEVEVVTPAGERIWVLINHFKSKGGNRARGDARRKRQADRVAEILEERYDLSRQLVVVAGDLNDTPGSEPLRQLLNTNNLHDVLAVQFDDPADRWTYNFRSNEQIDYLLVSSPLREALQEAGVERRGIAEVAEYTEGEIQPFSSISTWRDAASDHAAVWAEFSL